MCSIFKILKKEIREARFIAEVKSIKKRAELEQSASGLNDNQFYKLSCIANSKIESIAVNHRRRMNK